MNISESEEPVKVIAKTCCCCNDKSNNSGRKVTYSFVNDYHNLCLDKKDIISAELEAVKDFWNIVVIPQMTLIKR